MVEDFDLARVDPDGQTLRVKMRSFVVMSVVGGVVVLAVEPLGVPEASVDAAPVFRGDRLTAQRYDQGEDEFCHGVALPCVMVSAVHLMRCKQRKQPRS